MHTDLHYAVLSKDTPNPASSPVKQGLQVQSSSLATQLSPGRRAQWESNTLESLEGTSSALPSKKCSSK